MNIWEPKAIRTTTYSLKNIELLTHLELTNTSFVRIKLNANQWQNKEIKG